MNLEWLFIAVVTLLILGRYLGLAAGLGRGARGGRGGRAWPRDPDHRIY